MSVRNPTLTIVRLLTLSAILSSAVTFAVNDKEPSKRLVSTIEYTFVGHREETDKNGRVLVWVADISGDLDGEMKWWFADPAPVSSRTYVGGNVSFYAARWEFWVGDQLALAGESAGKTVFAEDSDGMWDGHGVVTETNGDYESLQGRRVYETGPVIVGSDPPISYAGTGMFQIY
ncbi:MAG: hypothetical protein ACR2Q3_11150 [Woeseiaceae bacterium]